VNTVLALNVGSSSLKAELYEAAGDSLRPLEQYDAWDAVSALSREPVAVGHRIVFGGPNLMQPVVAADAVLCELDAVAEFEPLHLPAQLSLCRQARVRFPNSVHVLCFDTAFHATRAAVARALPLPPIDPVLARYGFHGLSYEYIATQIPPRERTIAAHIGAGASVCAMRDRRSIDTTMGFTAYGGVMMATRCGDLDPGVLLFLLERGFDAARLRDLLSRQSGLLGVSQCSADVREVIEAAPTDARAAAALDLYVYQFVKAFGSMIAVLGGVDRIVFTGGIGEHQPQIRERICAPLTFLANVPVQVIPANENRMIAQHAWEALQ
jgi:acetate kinase